MKADQKWILLADMNAFFASCHQSVEPHLRNKPIIVGGSTAQAGRGMVIAASYEAKQKGVYTTMSNFEAKRLCPEAIFVLRDHLLYQQFSNRIMTFLKLIGPTEIASIDEAYVDVTKRVVEGTRPADIARYIQKTLWEKLHMPCSIGVGPNKQVAKMAAEIKKPRGYVQLSQMQYCAYYHPQPLSELYGCGKKTTEKLNRYGIQTIGQLAAMDSYQIRLWLGKRGEQLRLAAQGIGSEAVDDQHEKGNKSIGREHTFTDKTADATLLLATLEEMVEELSGTLHKKNKRARTISIVYKHDRLESSLSKSFSLPAAIDDKVLIFDEVKRLFETYLLDQTVQLIGVRLTNIEEKEFEQLKIDDFL